MLLADRPFVLSGHASGLVHPVFENTPIHQCAATDQRLAVRLWHDGSGTSGIGKDIHPDSGFALTERF